MKIKLIEMCTDLQRGDIIRCKGKYPYEDIIDFMVAESYNETKGYALWVVSGYKSGLIFTTLPIESKPNGNNGYAISRQWLIENWHNWGYFDCEISDVDIILNNAK